MVTCDTTVEKHLHIPNGKRVCAYTHTHAHAHTHTHTQTHTPNKVFAFELFFKFVFKVEAEDIIFHTQAK